MAISADLQSLLRQAGVENTAAIGAFATFFDLIGDVGGVVGGAINIVNLVESFIPGFQAPTAQIINKLNAIYTLVNATAKAGDIFRRNDAIDQAVNGALTACDLIAGKLDPTLYSPSDAMSGALSSFNYFRGARLLGATSTWDTTYILDSYWTDAGIYQETVQSSDGTVLNIRDTGYGQRAPSPNTDGVTVFDYRYSLPNCLFVVATVLAVGAAFDPNYATNLKLFLGQAASLLQSLHDTIAAAIIPLSPPFFPFAPGVTFIYQEGVPPLPELSSGMLIEYGAVEPYSGYSSIVDNYQIYWEDVSDSAGPMRSSAVFNKLQLRVLAKQKEVYLNVGLVNVWRVWNQVNLLAGEPGAPKHKLSQWSFNEISTTLGLTRSAAGWSLKMLAKLIVSTPPNDTPYTNVPAGTTISLRTLLRSVKK